MYFSKRRVLTFPTFLANGKDIQLIINTHVEASKIGRQIAEQVIDSHRRRGDSSSGSSPDPDPESSLSQSLPSTEVSQFASKVLRTKKND